MDPVQIHPRSGWTPLKAVQGPDEKPLASPAVPIQNLRSIKKEGKEGMSVLPLLMFLAFFVLGIGGTILWVWMIVDCATKEKSDGNEKLIWILVILLTHWIGALIYLLMRRPQRIQELGA
jgi:hypothetical protein